MALAARFLTELATGVHPSLVREQGEPWRPVAPNGIELLATATALNVNRDLEARQAVVEPVVAAVARVELSLACPDGVAILGTITRILVSHPRSPSLVTPELPPCLSPCRHTHSPDPVCMAGDHQSVSSVCCKSVQRARHPLSWRLSVVDSSSQ